MTILRGRPLFLVHPQPISRLLRHLSLSCLWPYALYLYVCPVYLSLCCLVVNCEFDVHVAELNIVANLKYKLSPVVNRQVVLF
jgi:hypothetical protein